ncbi:polyprenyl synthetase family protein [Trichlorobacter ammonificans]|uniref:Geranyl diphosphate/farnesyl diphosphate synthase n=1 Tax=Trichlorobacter ammonificans TaxID=2916410 RepID=A0ABM9D8R5_9BACT|nr:farnesyl diphosphate synthase [Trichlorobacter ammonificans]CAH2031610.1 geranyl diphosphate/farnesyl diphosphate synthase [Trichlorobacter ammonificans]
MDFTAYLKERIALVDQALDQYLPAEEKRPQSIHTAMRYSIFAGGKRVRPVLMLAACETVGGKLEAALPAACAMEMIHTYSLIHDDLPAMDDDDFRRGRPTNHKVFGEAIAILAGDGLLTEAFKLLSDPRINGDIPAATRLAVISEIATCAGTFGMVGGQVVDMESEGKPEMDLPTVQYIHTHKTGALIKAAVVAGALLGGADEQGLAAIRRYGEAAGLAFQIADDILDIEGTTEEIGKDAGSDEARGKATYPAVMGLAAAKQEAQAMMDDAFAALVPFGGAADPLRNIARYIVERKN